ncbi:tyrosine-type recombinase/integrase [Romboutsia lituseburensis]|uniref:tyrosine-type recombinase/integrase n=1 Tax=Romboutsia lituseburensis TaxID=1537 RepID=UPI0022EAC32E|nr:tyrosine-type recombinase/integrase [Romboutsia lituseburensis]
MENENSYTSTSIDRSDLKVPANPIPYNQLKRFRYRLKERSKKWPERNEALLMLQIATGYRAQDLVDLTIGEIKESLGIGNFAIQEKKQIRAYETKRKNYFNKYNEEPTFEKPKKRIADICKSSETYKILFKYIEGKKNSEYAFPSDGKYGYITSKSWSRILKPAGEDIGLENITAHSPRKTFATMIYEEYNDILVVKRQLGHKYVDTTEKYIGIYKEERRKVASLMASKV